MVVRKVFCQKLKKEANGLKFPPLPGERGQYIFENISQEAWDLWLKRQIMFINEYRLNLAEKKARDMLLDEMERFLFSDEEKYPEGYQPD